MKKILLCTAFLACIGLTTGSPAAGTSTTDATTPARVARVATGTQVPLVSSARTETQWSAKRPHYRDLRPKVRGTFD